MREFAKGGEHLNAMKIRTSIALEIRTLAYETTMLPEWKEAK